MTGLTTRQTLNVLTFGLIVYEILAFVYAMHGAETGTGLAGSILAVQMQLVSRGSIMLTAILTMGLLNIPAVAAGIAIFRIWPELGQAAQNQAIQNALATPEERLKSSELSWSMIWAITGGIVGLGAITAGTLYVMNQQDRSAGVYELNLAQNGQTSVPGGVTYVRMRGELKSDFLVGFEQKSSRSSTGSIHVYIPVTGEGWKPDEPVQYLVHHTSSGTSRPVLPVEFQSSGQSVIAGKFGDDLPVYVKQKLSDRGLKLAPTYRVLNYEPITENEAPESYSHLIALGGGFFVAIIAFGALAGGKLMTRRMIRKTLN